MNSNFINLERAGVDVNWNTALNVSTFYACVKNISEDIAKLPLNLYLEVYQDDKLQKYIKNQLEAAKLVRKKPNEINSGFDLNSFLIASAAMNGNGYAYIKRDEKFNPIAIYPIWSNDVTPLYVSNGTMKYKVTNTIQRPFDIPSEIEGEDMIHVRGLSLDGCVGVSIIRYACESLGGAIASTDLANNVFKNGANVGGILSFPHELDDASYNRIKNSWNNTYGGPNKAGGTALVEQGATYTKVSLSPEDAQLLATREFQVTDICRWFRMPPHKVQHLKQATFSNIEHQAIEYVQDCLVPWAEKLQNEYERKLLTSEQLYNYNFRFDFSELLRGDSIAQAEYISKLVTSGVIQINEARRYMFQNPVEGGDITLVPLNLLPLDKVDSYYNKDIQS